MEEMIYTKKREKRKILDENDYQGYHYMIVSYGTHPCAYIRIDEGHPLYKKDDDYVNGIESLDHPHGGWTWAGCFPNEPRIPGFYLGWDYDHYGDFNGAAAEFISEFGTPTEGYHRRWTTEEILDEMHEIIDSLAVWTMNENAGANAAFDLTSYD